MIGSALLHPARVKLQLSVGRLALESSQGKQQKRRQLEECRAICELSTYRLERVPPEYVIVWHQPLLQAEALYAIEMARGRLPVEVNVEVPLLTVEEMLAVAGDASAPTLPMYTSHPPSFHLSLLWASCLLPLASRLSPLASGLCLLRLRSPPCPSLQVGSVYLWRQPRAAAERCVSSPFLATRRSLLRLSAQSSRCVDPPAAPPRPLPISLAST